MQLWKGKPTAPHIMNISNTLQS